MTARLRPYPVYKSSSVPWLGRIPEDWAIKPLKRCAAINQATLTETTDPDFAFQYVDIGAVGEGRMVAKPQRLSFAAAPSRARRVVRPGDTMISTVRTYLKAVCHVASCDEPTVASTGFAVLTPSDMMVPRFLFYSVLSEHFIRRVSANSVGASYPAIEPSRLGCLPIAVPSDLAEQVQISSFLDVSLAAIGRLIRAKRRQIELLNEQKRGIINGLLTRGLNPAVALKQSGVHWLGEIPVHWSLRKLKYLVRITSGQVDPRAEAYRDRVLIAPNHIEGGTGRIVYEETAAQQGADSGKYIVRKGQVIYSKIRPNLRKATISPYDCLCSADMYPLQPDPTQLRTEFLLLLLLSDPFTRYAVDSSMRVAMPKINRAALGQCWLWYPSLHEQDQILHAVSSAVMPIDEVISASNRQIALLREYRTRLIADVVTGKLDVRNVELLDFDGAGLADGVCDANFVSDLDDDEPSDTEEVEADAED